MGTTAAAVERSILGAQPLPEGVRFRVWAPKRRSVSVVLETSKDLHSLQPEGGGYFTGVVPALEAGALYRYRLDDDGEFPDPVSYTHLTLPTILRV